MIKHPLVKEFKEVFLKELESTPTDCMLSLSGGIESSCIYYGLIELGRKPKSLTFHLEGVDSSDLYFTEKICKKYDTELVVVDIPRVSVEELIEELHEILKVTDVPRSIDTQVCYVYSKCFPQMSQSLIAGFFSGVLYGPIAAKTFIKFSEFKKGRITEKQLNEHLHYNRKLVYTGRGYTGRKHNYIVIDDFLKYHGYNLISPLRSKSIYDFYSNFSFQEIFNSFDGKIHPKWNMVMMFQEHFDNIGNHDNRKNMHVEGGVKEYFESILLEPYNSECLSGVYHKIMRKGKSLEQFFGE